MNKVEFADKTNFQGTCVLIDSDLMIKTSKEEAVKHFTDFMNPKKTKIITYYMDTIKYVYEGFTVFSTINVDLEGLYTIYLTSQGSYSEKKYFTVPREFVPQDMLDIAEFEH